jgi:hypothetical protein
MPTYIAFKQCKDKFIGIILEPLILEYFTPSSLTLGPDSNSASVVPQQKYLWPIGCEASFPTTGITLLTSLDIFEKVE